jgi:hypothetical protein
MPLRRLTQVILFAATAALAAAGSAPADGAYATGRYRNLFAELLGKSDAEVQAKIDAAWVHFFHGRDADQRLFYPVGADQAYIADIGNQDVRSEGMSYGLMIAVQLDKRAEFDRLWRWAKTHMYHADGPRAGYFSWQCRFDGTQIDPGSASDGEEWMTMALLFAATAGARRHCRAASTTPQRRRRCSTPCGATIVDAASPRSSARGRNRSSFLPPTRRAASPIHPTTAVLL